jgi:hypothetical protein
VHAVLSVESCSLELPLQVTAFYRDLKSDRCVLDAATTALACCHSASQPAAEATATLMSRCTAEIVRVFGVSAARGET